jgi:hypothetical protein
MALMHSIIESSGKLQAASSSARRVRVLRERPVVP